MALIWPLKHLSQEQVGKKKDTYVLDLSKGT